ncbi:RAI1-like [Trinorchestia longiramus]|nr:RAI1-like [Trinorchestia longiramus]
MSAYGNLNLSIIGDYSMDGRRRFHHDRRNLSHINLNWVAGGDKTVQYNLNQSQHLACKREVDAYANEFLTNILEWILLNKSCLNPAPDFISARKTLRRVLHAACTTEEEILYATKFRGTIYLCALIVEDRPSENEQQRRMSSWGYKFEQYMADGSDPRTGVNENESYSCIMRAQLRNHSLIYKCEVDGVETKLHVTNRLPHQHELLELKTHNMKFMSYGLNKYKLRDTWIQCALAGIPRVVVGYRDDNGMVHRLRCLQVKDLPRLAHGFFNPDNLMRFLETFLRWAKSTVIVDDPSVVYELKVTKSSFRSRIVSPGSPVTVLPPHYVQRIRRN